MAPDAFGLFRGWCRVVPSCLEYLPTGVPNGPADMKPLRCSNCGCSPQQHQPIECAHTYDPHSERERAARSQYDERLQIPAERAARHKTAGDAAFRAKNYRTAYERYSAALEAEPNSAVVLSNRCQAYLKAQRPEAALRDAERAVGLDPEWSKARFRLGRCLQALERYAESVEAFKAAAALEPESLDIRRAAEEAARQLAKHRDLEVALEEARFSTTRRQASDRKATLECDAKLEAKRSGRIRETTDWTAEDKAAFEAKYETEWEPPPGVRLLAPPVHAEAEPGAAAGEVATRGAAPAAGATGGDDAEEAAAAHSEALAAEEKAADEGQSSSEDDNYLSEDEEEKVPAGQFTVGSRTLMLPARTYTLVHEDGRLHQKDKFEPMSFGMQQVHHDAAPEPVWVQTHNARWLQSTNEVTVIAHTVPKELRRGSALRVSFAPRQVHVSALEGGEIFLHGELERPIDPRTSTWCTDGDSVQLTLVKQNLQLYDAQAKGEQCDTHWHRLFTCDQYTERGMLGADYSELPKHIRHRNKMAELARRDKEEKDKERNLCTLCGKDVRFFCNCRAEDPDYERPLPEGWKNSALNCHDPLFGDVRYDAGKQGQLAPAPPPQPAPYRGR